MRAVSSIMWTRTQCSVGFRTETLQRRPETLIAHALLLKPRVKLTHYARQHTDLDPRTSIRSIANGPSGAGEREDQNWIRVIRHATALSHSSLGAEDQRACERPAARREMTPCAGRYRPSPIPVRTARWQLCAASGRFDIRLGCHAFVGRDPEQIGRVSDATPGRFSGRLTRSPITRRA